jgi:hypothetical protein
MGGTYDPPVRGLGNPRPFKAGRRSAIREQYIKGKRKIGRGSA